MSDIVWKLVRIPVAVLYSIHAICGLFTADNWRAATPYATLMVVCLLLMESINSPGKDTL